MVFEGLLWSSCYLHYLSNQVRLIFWLNLIKTSLEDYMMYEFLGSGGGGWVRRVEWEKENKVKTWPYQNYSIINTTFHLLRKANIHVLISIDVSVGWRMQRHIHSFRNWNMTVSISILVQQQQWVTRAKKRAVHWTTPSNSYRRNETMFKRQTISSGSTQF